MARTRKTAIWIGEEATYRTAPAGSAHLYVPALSIGPLKDGMQLLETNYFTGRNFPTAPEVGADGWSFDFEVGLIGLASAAGEAVSVGADDWLDVILEHIFAESTDVVGVGVGIGSTTTTLVLDSAPSGYARQLLVPFFETSIPSAAAARTQWTVLTVDAAGTFTGCVPSFTAPSTAAIAYGSKTYLPSDAGGTTRSFVYRRDDLDYTLLGGRCTAASIIAEEGQLVRLKLTFSGDTKTQETTAGLPAIIQQTQPVVRALLSPFWFNGTSYDTRKIEIDFGIQAAEQEATGATNGRANWDSIGMKPTVIVEPLFAAAFETIKRTPTRGRLLVQLGSGVLASARINALAVHAEQAALMTADQMDENGRVRHGLTFQLTDPVDFQTGATGLAAHFFKIVRA